MATPTLLKLEKLIDRAVRPTSKNDYEAESAAMSACALIREKKLFIYDPEASAATQPVVADESAKAKLERVMANNPVRLAVKRRQEERERAEIKRRSDLNKPGQ